MASGRTGGAQGVNRRCADAPKRASCQLLLSPLRRLVEREVQRDPAAEHRGRERDVSNPPAISDSRSMNQEATITTSAGPNLTTAASTPRSKACLSRVPGMPLTAALARRRASFLMLVELSACSTCSWCHKTASM